LIKMSNGLNNFYLIVALVAAAFAAGRFYANGSLIEENHKLNESLRFLRGEKIGFVHEKPGIGPWRDEKRPTAVAMPPVAASGRGSDTKPALPAEVQPVTLASAATPALAAPMATTPTAVAEKPRTETVTQDSPPKLAASQPEPGPLSAPALVKPEAAPAPPAAKDGKTGKKWVADLGGNVQGTATYWHCNNATLVASGMDYYAYGSVPASSLKKQGDAYSVRDGRAIVVSGCWSPRLGKAILYRKSVA